MSDPLSDIQKQYRRLVIIALSTAACMIFGLFSLLYVIPIGVCLIAIALVLYFALFRPNRRAYSDLVDEINLERTTCRLIGSPVPKPVGGGIFTRQTLSDSDLVPLGKDDGDPLFCWEMKGHRKIIDTALADTTQIHKYKGAAGKYLNDIISGVFSVFDMPQDAERYFLVMDRQFLPDAVRELHMNAMPWYVKEPLGDPDLDMRYFFYRSTRDTGDEIPRTFLHSLKRLMNYSPGFAALTVKGSRMYAFITDRFVSRRVVLSRLITMEDLDTEEFPELRYLLNIAASFTTGSRKAGRGRIKSKGQSETEADDDNEEWDDESELMPMTDGTEEIEEDVVKADAAEPDKPHKQEENEE